MIFILIQTINFANLAYDFVTKSLPAEYLDIINRETLVDNFNAGELASIAKVGKLLYGEKLFKENETIDYENVLREENVNKLSKYISESMLLTEGMEGVANLFLKDLEYEGQAITL